MYGLRRESRDVTTVPISHSHELTTDFSRVLKSHTPKHFWCICRTRRFQVSNNDDYTRKSTSNKL